MKIKKYTFSVTFGLIYILDQPIDNGDLELTLRGKFNLKLPS